MKLNKALIIIFNILLFSCSLVSHQSLYYINSYLCNIELDDIKDFENYNNNVPYKEKKCKHSFIMGFNEAKQFVLIILPGYINGGLGGGFLENKIFFISTKKKYPTFENNNKIFSIQIHGVNKKMDDLFKKNINIKLKVSDKIYNYSKKTFIGYDIFFYFPLQIKDIKKGTLVIEYKDIKEEVDFELGFEKHVVPN